MVSALNSGMSGLDSSPGRGHCDVFLGKILYSLFTTLARCITLTADRVLSRLLLQKGGIIILAIT